jgi:hypothetical protein
VSSDTSYFARRAADERRIAAASVNPRARLAHLELAVRYATLAGADPDAPEVQDAVAERL